MRRLIGSALLAAAGTGSLLVGLNAERLEPRLLFVCFVAVIVLFVVGFVVLPKVRRTN